MSTEMKRDRHWVNNSFLIPETEAGDPYAVVYRTYNSAMGKFVNSSLGGNWVINPLPQLGRYTDPRETPLYNITDNASGMGGYYSEAFDDNYQKVHFRFGVPSFNTVASFLANCYSIEASSLARTGRAPGIMFKIGRAAGSLLALPVSVPLFFVRSIKFLTNVQSSKYYTLRPTMHNYWSAVSLMVNNIAATLSIVPRIGERDHEGGLVNGVVNTPNEARQAFEAIPTVFHPSGMIDVMALATRAAILGQTFHDQLDGILKDANTPAKRAKKLLDIVNEVHKARKPMIMDPTKMPAALSLDEYLDEMLNSDFNQLDPLGTENDGSTMNYNPRSFTEHESFLGRLQNAYTSLRKEAAEFVTFRVNNTGTQTESFTTSSKESGIASTINSMSSGARETRFNITDGNIDGGIIDKVIGMGTDFLSGLATSFKLEGLGMLAGNAYVDIPKMPDGTTAEINRFSFNMNLRSPYGHDLARLTNEIIPMCAILAGVLPMSTGRHSYTTPLMCEVFCRGRVHIRAGMIDSVTVSRGTGDIAWLQDGKWMGTDIAVSVSDMTSVIHMPIVASTGTIGNAVGVTAATLDSLVDTVMNNNDYANTFTTGAAALMSGTYDDDSLYSDYMNILGSVEFDILTSRVALWGLRARRQVYNFNQFRSPSNVLSSASNGIVGDVFKAFSERTARGATGS